MNIKKETDRNLEIKFISCKMIYCSQITDIEWKGNKWEKKSILAN